MTSAFKDLVRQLLFRSRQDARAPGGYYKTPGTKRSRVNCFFALLLAVIFCALPMDSAAFAQGRFVESWSTNQREKSQRLLSAAMTALNKEQVDQASTLLIQATLADPTDAAPLAVLGMTYLRQGKYSEALVALKKSYEINHLPETLLSAGFAYYLQHDYDAAIASWTKALERDPKMVEANANIGFAYMRKGDFAKSDEFFHNLISAKPSSQLAYQGLANLNYLAGHFTAARNAAEQAQSIQSYFPVILLLAKLDFLQGDAKTGQKRVAEWQRSSSGKRALLRSMTTLGYPVQHDFHWDPFLSDNFDNGRLLLARTQISEKGGESQRKSQAQQGKIQELLAKAKQAQFTANKDFYITRELALIEMANADYVQSAEHFSEVLQLCPACLVDFLLLAKAQSGQNKTTEASYAIHEFQRQRPNEKIATQFLNLGKGEAAATPELPPQAGSQPSKGPPESGF